MVAVPGHFGNEQGHGTRIGDAGEDQARADERREPEQYRMREESQGHAKQHQQPNEANTYEGSSP